MFECAKCGGDDINIIYREDGEPIDYMCSDNDEFIDLTDRFNKKVKKEHLRCICRTCAYKWRKKTKDNTNAQM